MFQTKDVEKIKTHILFSVTFFLLFRKSSCYEKMWKNIVEPGRPQITIWRMRIVCRIRKTTNTHTQVMWYSLLFHCNSVCTNAP